MSQYDPADLDIILDALMADFDYWTYTLPDGRTLKALHFAKRWAVSIWYQGEMLELWNEDLAGEV